MTDGPMAGSRTSAPRRRSRHWVRWALAVVCVALGGGAGLIVHQELPRVYTASTTVLVLPTAGGVEPAAGSRAAADVHIETEAQVAHSAQVAALASKSLKAAISASDLLRDSSVFVPSNSQVLIVDYEAATPELARDGAMALSTAYIDRRSQEAAADKDVVVKSLESQLADLTTRLQENSATLAAVPATDTGGRALAEAQRNLLVDQIADVNSRLVALRFQTTTGGEVITAAALPKRPTSPVLTITLGAGLVAGALAAAGLLLMLDRRDRRREPRERDLLTASGVVRLATVPLAEPRRALSVNGTKSSSTESPALRTLADEISRFDGALGPTVLVGILEPALRARFAQRLTAVLAGDATGILVFAEHGPHVHAVRPAAAEPGFSDALQGRAPVDVISSLPGQTASVMGPGSGLLSLDPATHGPVLTSLWSRLEREFGTVLVDVSSPFGSSIAQAVAATAGRIVVAVDERHTDDRALLAALEALDLLGLSDRIIGVVGVRDASGTHVRARHAKPSSGAVHSAEEPSADDDKEGEVRTSSEDDDSLDELATDRAMTRPAGQFDGT